ncbi:ABC transporter ATP-binding protein [Solemya velum gill symbiont]|uniref:ABC-type antimicrobial peptide transport system SalXY, subunit X n=3 Tax=Solemya velum gill symbiont TaxID=2340 RepID=A0A0B0HAY6_SOVGS|nr:ABC transporter ATP-binding protein [Solemya velum gill symbiont]KHF25029.1 ABC-type antimicrobial peptide transport system SalXY, subunit X [Solemya velum gill symbiont]OOY37040.1 macrolide ABC transporter ATP-binding protein [Solemya velum gill symbiont]OOY40257.1 macrolide ABC transporter ATP-binding protein [Solemya velum gill symbiont]OOY42760.1 macrolide ABC transporter ATP-binding protein [Solemya velum gill symbiont]OOY50423.1 macrolide ABC transporter ATP-binding protein [Solemya v
MIELDSIERVFQVGDEEVHALKHVTLTIKKGEYLSIMGPSGSGKSTLLNILGLLDRPTSGTYRLDSIDTTSMGDNEQADTRRHRIGFVFQSYHLVPRLTAAENVALPLMLSGMAPKERQVIVEKALDNVDLLDRADHRPDQLSGGQRQRVAIARATIMQPTILLADEPTGNLDHVSGESVIEVLEALNKQGIILIVVTHDMEIGERATRRIRMVDGSISKDIS